MELVLNMNLIIMTPISINLFIFIDIGSVVFSATHDLIKINKLFKFMILPLSNTHLHVSYLKIY